MRVGLVAYPVNSRGGVFRWLTETVAMLSNDHEVFVLVGGLAQVGDNDLPEAVDISRLGSIRRNPLSSSGVPELRQWAAERSLDVLVSALPRANALALRVGKGMPVMPTLHGALPRGPRGAIYRLLFRRRGSHATAVGVVSEHLTADASDLFRHTPVVRLPNAVPTARASIHPQRTGVAWVGRLVPEKGVSLLAAVACRLDGPVEVMGSGVAAALLDDAVEQGCITLRGWVNDPVEYLTASTIFLSTSDSEGMPYALLDAVGAGCVPVVSTAAFGWLDLPSCCVYSNADELVQNVNSLLQASPAILAAIAQSCRVAVERHHSPELLERGWSELLGRAGGSR